MANNNPLTAGGYRPGDVIKIDLQKADEPFLWLVGMSGPGASDGGPYSCRLIARGGTPHEALTDFFDTVEAYTNDPHETMQP